MNRRLSFPALAFQPDVGRYAVVGRERLTWFLDAKDFETCTSWDLTRNARLGMLLVDHAGHCWRVSAVKDLGVVGSPIERVLRFFVQQSVHRVDQEIVPAQPMTLDELKDRAVKSIRANPDDWRDDEVIAGEAGPMRSEAALLDEMEAAVRGAASVSEIINRLYGEDFDV